MQPGDVSLGPSVSTLCPTRVVFDVRPPDGVDPIEMGEAARLRVAERERHQERFIAATLEANMGGVQLDAGLSGEERIAGTTAAMERGATLIAGGVLADMDRRSGQPVLLLRAEFDGRWRYHPVTIGAHRILTVAFEEAVEISHPSAPTKDHSGPLDDHRILANRRIGNGMRLAHLHRLLDSLGRASSHAVGAMVGIEATFVWVELDNTEGQPTILETYDLAFAERRDNLLAVERLGAPDPVQTRECSSCPWRAHCGPIIENTRCTSSIQSISRGTHRRYGSLGIHTIDDLASIDPDTIDDSILDDLVWPRERLIRHIDEARALAWRPGTALLRRGLGKLEVPSFDREIDIDMESGIDGHAYLWGVYDASTDSATHDVDWEVDAELAAARVFVAFWERIAALLTAAAAAEESIGFYCWHDQAERTALRSGAKAAAHRLGLADGPENVEAFLRDVPIIDLCAIAQRDLVTGRSKSLKTMAPLAGFAWRDDEPSGEASMAWHASAVDRSLPEIEQDRWRQRLIEYNEDDVRAEAAVRQWMRQVRFEPADSVRR